MKAILENICNGYLKDLCTIKYIFSNNREAHGIETARQMGFPVNIIDSKGRKRSQYNDLLKKWLLQINPDYIILAGYMLIIPPEIIDLFPQQIINIHPADTNLHQGLHGYEWAWDNKLAETTITIHFVDHGLDTGRIIAQKKVDLNGVRSLDEVETRGLKTEHQFYSEVLEKLLKEKYQF